MDQALVEKVARAMTVGVGRDPDEMVPRSGYAADKNNLIPRWYFNIEWAQRHIAATSALLPPDSSSRIEGEK